MTVVTKETETTLEPRDAKRDKEKRRKHPVRRLGEMRPTSLQDIQARRRQLISLMLVVFVLLAAGVALISLATETFLEKPFELVDFRILRVSFIVMALTFALYVAGKERELGKIEAALVEAQTRAVNLSNRLRELSALTQAGKAVSAVLSLDDVMQVILESARDLLAATEGSVMLFDEEKRHLRVAAAVGIDEEAKESVVEVGEGVAGWVAQVQEPVILQGDLKSERFAGFIPKRRQVRSAMSAPLFAQAEPVGVLNVSISSGDRTYTQQDLQALTVFAEHAAIAIANARLFEKEKAARERLADIDAHRREFVATLTHDLKAPLTSILGYAQLLKRSGGRFTDNQARDFVNVIDRQGRRILDMVERLVVATRLEEGRPTLTRERLDLPAIISDQLEGLRGSLGDRRVEVRAPDEIPVVFGDRPAIEHIVGNLLDNAMKYSPEGTGIEVDVQLLAREVCVSVTDEGSGIPEEMLPDVFDRYQRASQQGGNGSVGLGLFIVKSLADAHGGRAWAENADGKGARVSFTLPFRHGDR